MDDLRGDTSQRKENLKSLMRKNNRSYTIKDNKDRFLFPEEYMAFEDKLKTKAKHSAKIQINTGGRHEELANVVVEDCDLERKRIILRITKVKAKKGEKKPRPRIIPISSQFSKYLKKYFTENKLTGSDRIGMLSNPALNVAFKKSARESGIKDYWNISSHTFRKTLECWLMALGVDSLPLVAHLGHDLKTASQHYVSPDIFSWEDKKRMREVIGDLYQR
jgi:integrase